MYAVLLTLFILVSLVLMIIILLQSSKGGGLAGALGGGSDSSVMGGRSAATFLGKLTVWLAVSFMALALILAVMSSRVTTTDVQEDGIIAKRQQEGSLDVFDVNEGGTILDQIQTEGFEPEGEQESTDETPAPAQDEPTPAGN